MSWSTMLVVGVAVASLAAFGSHSAAGAESGSSGDAPVASAVRPMFVVATTAAVGSDEQPPGIETFIVDGSGGEPKIPEDARSDYEFFAQQNGQSVEEVYADQAGVSDFNIVAYDLAQAHKATFVNSGVSEDRDEYDYWIHFTGRPDDEVVAALGRMAGATQVRYASSLTAADLERASGAVVSSFIDSSEAILAGGTQSTFDDEFDGVAVTFSRSPGVTDEAVQAAIDRAIGAAREAVDGVTLQLTFIEQAEPDLASTAATVKGGGPWFSGSLAKRML